MMAAAAAAAVAAAAAAEAAAAEALLAPKLQAMEAAGFPAWKVQAMEAEEREKICSSLQKKMRELRMKINDLSDMNEKAKVKEVCTSLTQEYLRIAREIRTPDYSGMTEAERAAEAERLKQEKLQEARRLEREGNHEWLEQERLSRIMDFDSKQDGMYFNRMSLYSSEPTFDIDEESPFGPMRFTNKVYGSDRPEPCEAINFLSVNIECSDVGFPIQVFGSVIARDSIDHKCVYLFRRDRDHCQFISSEDESLILTGPKRGLALVDDNYVETDLKIKDHEGQDRELSKGILRIGGISTRSLEKCEVERDSIDTRLSTVDVLYAVVKEAVEGTLVVRVLKGEFNGTITAHTTSIQNRIMLYDSESASAENHGVPGVIQLMRSVVSVYVWDMLIIEAKTSAGKFGRLEFTPRYNSEERDVITLGATKIRVIVAWSIMDP